jgi:hypothetical protein
MNKTVKGSLIIIGVLVITILIITSITLNTKAKVPEKPDLPDTIYKCCCTGKNCQGDCIGSSVSENGLTCPPGIDDELIDYKYGCDNCEIEEN